MIVPRVDNDVNIKKDIKIKEVKEQNISTTNEQVENTNNTNIIEEKKDNDLNNEIEEKKEIITDVPQIDYELEKVKSLCEYFDYSSCRKASIDVALSDTDNIENTACDMLTYNGNIVGYRIIIYFRDGTNKYHNAT